MPEFEMDALFERRLAQRLSDFANEAVRPFDAAQITAYAAAIAAERSLGARIAARMPRGWRLLVATALLALGLVGAGILGGFIKLPNNSIVPNPSFSPFSPLPVETTPLETPQSTASPIDTGVLPTVGVTGPPLVSPTPQPSQSQPPTPSPTASPTPTASPDPATLPVNKVVAVTTGDSHACALADDGRVFCWGMNDQGQLGDGTTSATEYRTHATVPVVGIDDATAITAGIRFTCAIRSDRTVWCWGEDPGSDGSSAVPFQVPGIDDATAITAGGAFACALRANGQIGCWGNGQAGQLGNGVYENNSGVPTPQRVLGIDNAIAVSAGWGHACALLADRTVECWGANGDGASDGSGVYGSLGDGTSDIRRATPAPVVGLDNVKDVQAGGWSTCATRFDGTVWCWGYGKKGEMGDGNFSNSSVPVQVAGIDDARLLALGDHSACVSRSDNSVWCWGDTFWSGASAGVPVAGNKSRPRVVTALANDSFCYLIDGNGQAWFWGNGISATPNRWPVGPEAP